MKCKEIRSILDNNFGQLKSQLDSETLLHLDSCENCRNYYQSISAANEVISALQSTEPILFDPHALTDKIMMDITNVQHQHSIKSNRSRILVWGQKLIMAASVCLLLTFGFEQYIVVNKIVALENKLSNISDELPAVSINRAQFFTIPDFYLNKLQEKPLLLYLLKQRSDLSEANSTGKSTYLSTPASVLFMQLLLNKNTIGLVDSMHYISQEVDDE